MALDSILSTPVIPPSPKSSVSSSSSSSSSSGSNASAAAGKTSDSSSATHQSSASSSNRGDGTNSDSGHATRSSGKNGSSRSSDSSSRQTQSSSKSSQSSQSSQRSQSSASGQAQSANAAANGKNAAAQSARNPGPSFLQTLAAQSQADAQDSATAATTASPPAITGKGKGKTAKDDTSAADSATSFGLLSQSLVVAMAGIQQQPSAAAAANHDDSVDGVSLSSGSSVQSLVANLIQNTADELKAATADGAKADAAPTNTTPTMDAGTAAAANFQSHLGVSSQSQTQASPQAANTQVNTPVGANGFADEVGDKITWIAHQGVQSASLQMTPEHMGPVEVKISVQAGSATVSINAAHPDTRAALEQALPRLREMFSTQGMNLTDASVSQQFSREPPQKRAIGAIGSVGGVSDEGASAVVSIAGARLGLVDTYA